MKAEKRKAEKAKESPEAKAAAKAKVKGKRAKTTKVEPKEEEEDAPGASFSDVMNFENEEDSLDSDEEINGWMRLWICRCIEFVISDHAGKSLQSKHVL